MIVPIPCFFKSSSALGPDLDSGKPTYLSKTYFNGVKKFAFKDGMFWGIFSSYSKRSRSFTNLLIVFYIPYGFRMTGGKFLWRTGRAKLGRLGYFEKGIGIFGGRCGMFGAWGWIGILWKIFRNYASVFSKAFTASVSSLKIYFPFFFIFWIL